MQYELSAEADEDLEEIFDYTYHEFGAKQAVKYVTFFEGIFESILQNPEIGRERNEIRLGLRSFIKESHVVFYRIIKDKIRIIRILHGAVDLPRHFRDY